MQQIIGSIVFVLGLFLFIGNVSGSVKTLPYAGFIAMTAGGAIFASGENKNKE